MTKASWARLILPLLGLTIGLGVSELAVRWILPQEPTPLLAGFGMQAHVKDDRYGWKLKPGYVGSFAFGSTLAVNSIGLRDVEYGPKAPGEIRILSIGDSNAFGWGVDLQDSFCKVLESKLRKEFSDSNISVINAAVTGYSTRQELLALEDLADVVQPDLVLVTFTAANDNYENHVFQDRVSQGIVTPLGPVGRHSHVARLVLRVTWPARFFVSNRSGARIRESLSLLDDLENEAHARHLPLLMIMMPARAETDPSARWQTKVLNTLFMRKLLSRPRLAVMSHWSERAVDYVDLQPSLSDATRTTNIFLEGDPHMNPEGHRVAAEAIFPRVRQIVADQVMSHRNTVPAP